MLVRPYKITDVRDYFVGAKQSGGYGQTIDKTGVKCIELIGASFVADETAIFGKPNKEYIEKQKAKTPTTCRKRRSHNQSY